MTSRRRHQLSSIMAMVAKRLTAFVSTAVALLIITAQKNRSSAQQNTRTFAAAFMISSTRTGICDRSPIPPCTRASSWGTNKPERGISNLIYRGHNHNQLSTISSAFTANPSPFGASHCWRGINDRTLITKTKASAGGNSDDTVNFYDDDDNQQIANDAVAETRGKRGTSKKQSKRKSTKQSSPTRSKAKKSRRNLPKTTASEDNRGSEPNSAILPTTAKSGNVTSKQKGKPATRGRKSRRNEEVQGTERVDTSADKTSNDGSTDKLGEAEKESGSGQDVNTSLPMDDKKKQHERGQQHRRGRSTSSQDEMKNIFINNYNQPSSMNRISDNVVMGPITDEPSSSNSDEDNLLNDINDDDMVLDGDDGDDAALFAAALAMEEEVGNGNDNILQNRYPVKSEMASPITGRTHSEESDGTEGDIYEQLTEESIAKSEKLLRVLDKLRESGFPETFAKNFTDVNTDAVLTLALYRRMLKEGKDPTDQDIAEEKQKIRDSNPTMQDVISDMNELDDAVVSDKERKDIEIFIQSMREVALEHIIEDGEQPYLVVPNENSTDLGRVITSSMVDTMRDNLRTGIRVRREFNEVRKYLSFLDPDVELSKMTGEEKEDIAALDISVPKRGGGGYTQEDFDLNRQQVVFDYQFNVSNLLLASFKTNPGAPVVKEEWMDALRYQQKYQYVRDLEFNFTWDDVDGANVEELELYWNLTGANGIPKPNKRENPNMVKWNEEPLSFAEEQMLALEKWYEEVYEDDDDGDLEEEDDEVEGFKDEKIDPYERDIDAFEKEYDNESREWKDQFYTKREFDVEPEDSENSKQCRGHLVIACSSSESDIDVAEKITKRMDKEFGPQVFVETRVYGHARQEDNVYEIWLESWEIELLHSKRKAVYDQNWFGPREVDDAHLDYLVDEVRFQISDDARNSFRLDDFPRTE